MEKHDLGEVFLVLTKFQVPNSLLQPWQTTPTLPFLSGALRFKQQLHLSSTSLLSVASACSLLSESSHSIHITANIFPLASNLTCMWYVIVPGYVLFFGIVWFTKKSCEVSVSVKCYTLQMRTPSLKHFIFLSKFTYLTIGRAELDWGDSILSIKKTCFY